MAMMPACVERLDRAKGRAWVALGSGEKSTIPVALPPGNPPPPLSYVMVDQYGPGVRAVRSSISRRKLMFLDDFNYVGATPNFGDTPWQDQSTFAFSAGGNTNAISGDEPGVLEIFGAGGASTYVSINKTAKSLTLGYNAYHLYMRYAPFTSNSHANYQWGFANDTEIAAGGTGDGAYLRWDVAGQQLLLRTVVAAVKTDTRVDALEPEFTAKIGNTFMDFDMLLVPPSTSTAADGFFAVWQDGNGPYINRTNVPYLLRDIKSYFRLSYDATGGNTGHAVSVVSLEQFDGWRDPDTIFAPGGN